ncbi:ribonuclease T2 family protein [Methylocystis hirsuta]|uniref:Ribonuclease T n=1 Tax=Methylocystis hirsuta TaxID=369798 RepID=A0A3M9XTN3_9HYPH|nr:ribonuclease T [Methylocystis hirsuta]RNJ50478.1 ribonuclease T [Methylocystis hirsuta]
MRRVFVRCAAWALLVGAVSSGGFFGAIAKEGDCTAEDCANRAASQAGAARDFDFYVLALSWSPGFCESVEGAHDQCEPGKGLGFVVHGLWPQYESGVPSECPGARSPSRVALEKAAGLFPDERLARYEWRKHGVCSGKSPSDYFADVARAHAAVAIPPLFVKPARDQTVTPIDVERAFYEANPRLRPGMMAVSCRRGVMDGVRICLSKDLREFRACPAVTQRGCHVREISAPAPL